MTRRAWRGAVAGVAMVGVSAMAGMASAQTKTLGTFGGWEISQLYDKGKFARCVADTTGPAQNEGLRMSFGNDGNRHFILPGPGTPGGSKEQAVVILQPSGKRFEFAMMQDRSNRMWSPVLENGFTDVFFESRRLEVSMPSHNVKRVFDLGDPDTMSARIDGCMASNH